MACINRFATAILSGETELALGTIRVNINLKINISHADTPTELKFCTLSLFNV